MCPACLSTVVLAVVGATSTGGLAAFLARRLRLKKRPRKGRTRKGRTRRLNHAAEARCLTRRMAHRAE